MSFEEFVKNKENVTLEMIINRITELESKMEKPAEAEKVEEPVDYLAKYFDEVIK